MSTNRKIAHASLILIAASAGCHALGLVKEIMVAGCFGITRAMDAFYAALAIPSLINNVLLSTFGAVFIPVYVRHSLADGAEANRIASAALRRLGFILALAASALFIGAPAVIGCGFRGLSPEGVALAVRILRIAAFTMVLSGMAGALSGILNAHGHFLWPALSPLCITLVTIAFIALDARTRGVMTLAWGLCAGLVAQCAVLLIAARREGFRPGLAGARGHPALREMTSGALLFVIGITAAQINIFVDSVMASYLMPGSLAALSYAAKLVMVPIAIFTASLATAVFPFFSMQAAGDRIGEMKDSLAKSIRMAGFIFLPMTAALVILARPLIGLLFQRGAFDRGATDLTSAIFACYALQLFFYTVCIILVRAHLAFRDMGILIRVAFAGVGMNIALNLLFILLIHPPAAGIALSTSLVQVIAMGMFYRPLARRIGSLGGRGIIPGLLWISLCTAAMAGGMCLVMAACRASACGPAARMAAAVCAGISIFTGAARALGVEELGCVSRLIRNWRTEVA
ncbi:MAG: murein biosynthesis integral membrane protein MurJ [Chlamydiota bacterium]